MTFAQAFENLGMHLSFQCAAQRQVYRSVHQNRGQLLGLW